ncbi:MAG: ABC transporter permease [Kiritimatiellae bacterium]|nr:ABC transporter permease [Kiritimatiellia bacterium]
MRLSRRFILKRDQISVLIAKDFKLKYDSTALGFLWSMLIPLLMSGVYYLVFGVLMRWGRVENYLLYLISGTFLWQFFANVVMQNGRIMMANAALLKKTAFDRRLLVWGTFFTEGAHFVLTIPVMILVMHLFGVRFTLAGLANIVLIVPCIALLAVGCGYFYAACNLYFRDLERIMTIVMMSWLYCSPVFIPIQNIPQKVLAYYNLNPMTGILCAWRDVFYTPSFHPQRMVYVFCVALAVFLAGRFVFRRLEPRFAEMM